MGEQMINQVATVAVAIVGLAIIAVLVSRNAQTGTVITSAGQAFAQDISAAVSPVVGGGGGYGLSNFGGFTMQGPPIWGS
jgi:hypothetical protein